MCPVSDRRWKQQRKFLFFPVGLHLTVTNDFCRILYINCPSVVVCETTWLLTAAALSRCGSSPRPPLHGCDLLQLGRGGPHAFCIARGYWEFYWTTQSVTSQRSACERIFSLAPPTFFLMLSLFNRGQWERTTFYCSFCFSSEEDFEWSRSINWLPRAGN